MKLVIDIPEETITKIKDNAMFAPNIDSDIKWDITNAIVNSEEETKMEMTVEQYRERMIEAFQNTGCEELIALVCPPNEKDFKAMESLLRNFWNKGGEEND